MSKDSSHGCPEYAQLSRRHFLGLTSGLAVAASIPTWLPQVVFAQEENSSRDVLVSIFLRGAADGLSLCVPFGEDAYYRHRPTLAVPRPGGPATGSVIDLDGFFGFPPAMAPLLPAFQDGKLAMVHACGLDSPTRSHFNAMHFVEVGAANPPASLTTGWLGRHLMATAPTLQDGLLRAVGIGFGLPRVLVGGPRTLPVSDLATFGLTGDPDTTAQRRAAIEALYAAAPDPLRAAAENTSRTIDLLQRIDFAGYQPSGGAVYPDDAFGSSLAATAALIKAQVGVEAVALDAVGWDTHAAQAPVGGRMAAVMASFAGGIGALYQDLDSGGAQRVTVVAMTEFGRNAFENASGGTDHGHGSVMFVLGSHVAGGRVVRDWPGLEEDQLYEGQDLQVTIDYRDVLVEILTKRLGNPDIRSVFADEGYLPQDRGIMAL